MTNRCSCGLLIGPSARRCYACLGYDRLVEQRVPAPKLGGYHLEIHTDEAGRVAHTEESIAIVPIDVTKVDP